MYKKKEDLVKEQIYLEIENTKKNKMIQFLGGNLSLYILAILILTFTTIWLYNQISGLLSPLVTIFNVLVTPVLVAYILYYILKPISNFLVVKVKLTAGVSSILAILFGIFVILTIFIGIIPVMLEQTQHLITAVPGYINTLRSYLAANADNQIVAYILRYINNNLNVAQFSSTAFEIFSNFVSNATSILSSMATIVITAPFVLFYLLKDAGKFRQYLMSHIPEKIKEPVNTTITEIDEKVGSYISGQILVSVCIGMLLFIGYNIIGLEYAISLATLAGVLSIIPYLGPMLSILPAMLVAVATDWVMVLKLVVVWGVVQFLEGNFISPSIMGRSMQIHALTVIFVILISTNMFGIVGAIIGIPVYAIIKILSGKIINVIVDRYNRIYHLEKLEVDLDKLIDKKEEE